MKLSIIATIAVSAIGITIIFLGFFSNLGNEEVENTLTPYEQLEKYRKDLEKIIQQHQQVLYDLEKQITESDDVHLEQINKEIEVLKRVINENKAELERVIKKLSETVDGP